MDCTIILITIISAIAFIILDNTIHDESNKLVRELPTKTDTVNPFIKSQD